MDKRLVANHFDQPGSFGNDFLHRGVLAVEDAQRIGHETSSRILVQRSFVSLEIGDQLVSVREAVVAVAERIHVQPDAVGQPQLVPQPREHDDLLGVDVGAFEAQRLDVELMELAIAAPLRALVTEHRPRQPGRPLLKMHSRNVRPPLQPSQKIPLAMRIMRQPARDPRHRRSELAAMPQRRQNRVHRVSVGAELLLKIPPAHQLVAIFARRPSGQRVHQLPGVLRHPPIRRRRTGLASERQLASAT